MTLLVLAPLAMWAQDNTWEKPEVEEEVTTQKAEKIKVNQKYLRGAVPEVNGQVVFTKHIDAPGKSASQIYDILHAYMSKMTKEKNQLESTKLVKEDAAAHLVAGWNEEWLVFRSNAIYIDQTRLYFALTAECKDGGADITMSMRRTAHPSVSGLRSGLPTKKPSTRRIPSCCLSPASSVERR